MTLPRVVPAKDKLTAECGQNTLAPAQSYGRVGSRSRGFVSSGGAGLHLPQGKGKLLRSEPPSGILRSLARSSAR